MTIQKPDLHILTIWRIRLLLLAVVFSFLSAWFYPHRGWIWWLFTLGWAGGFFYFYLFYYPIKFRKLSYARNQDCLLIHCGVIYTRTRAIPFSAIQYTSTGSTPLERLFGVCSLIVVTAGSRVFLPGLPTQDAQELQRFLSLQDWEDRGLSHG